MATKMVAAWSAGLALNFPLAEMSCSCFATLAVFMSSYSRTVYIGKMPLAKFKNSFDWGHLVLSKMLKKPVFVNKLCQGFSLTSTVCCKIVQKLTSPFILKYYFLVTSKLRSSNRKRYLESSLSRERKR